jgi:hypothetical protein
MVVMVVVCMNHFCAWEFEVVSGSVEAHSNVTNRARCVDECGGSFGPGFPNKEVCLAASEDESKRVHNVDSTVC